VDNSPTEGAAPTLRERARSASPESAAAVGSESSDSVSGSTPRNLGQSDPANSRPSDAVSAHALLRELREVARALPAGLDEVSLGQAMLRQVGDDASYERAVLFTLTDSDRAVPLTDLSPDRVSWAIDETHTMWRAALATSNAVTRVGSFSNPSSGVCALLPLSLGQRLIGAVAIERDSHMWSTEELAHAQTNMDSAALQLDSGRLFSEVRALATVEERRRLAREIHDGIAQEIASLGYVVDELVAEEDDPAQRKRIGSLRSELSRIVSELRLSIFDLRSDVQPHGGLGAALSSYIRQVGTSSGLTVHLVLDESVDRLNVETEVQFLRIAQQAVTNVRRHAKAKNLWVTCRVTPPHAFLRVADDGRGLGSPRIDSYGLDIMRERAGQLGVELTVRKRDEGGTVVEITLGSPLLESKSEATKSRTRKGWRRANHDSDR
jgi:signal transduction histidine kinase